MHSLALFHRIAGSRVVVVGEGIAAQAKRRLVERAGGICCSEAEAHQARLAFVAVDLDEKPEIIARRLKQRGLLVNVADRPELCDFTLPSILERDPVIVAVSTGGASAGLAKHLRLHLEAFLPASLGRLAQGLAEARDKIRARWPDPDHRRIALDEALSTGGPLNPLEDHDNGEIDRWLERSDATNVSVVIELQIGSDDPDDLTLKQARLLGQADCIVYEASIAPEILTRARADAARLTFCNEQPDAKDRPGLTLVLRRAR
ncbi:MAG: siroheme synthase [Sphingomonadaceae bacterium]